MSGFGALGAGFGVQGSGFGILNMCGLHGCGQQTSWTAVCQGVVGLVRGVAHTNNNNNNNNNNDNNNNNNN